MRLSILLVFLFLACNVSSAQEISMYDLVKSYGLLGKKNNKRVNVIDIWV